MPSAVRCLPDRWATVRWIYGGRAHEVEGTDGNSRTDRATDPAREGAAPPPHARAALEELFGEPASSPAGATLRQRWSRRSRTAHAGSAPGSRRPTWVTRRWTSCSTTCAASSSPTCSGPGSCLRVLEGRQRPEQTRDLYLLWSGLRSTTAAPSSGCIASRRRSGRTTRRSRPVSHTSPGWARFRQTGVVKIRLN